MLKGPWCSNCFQMAQENKVHTRVRVCVCKTEKDRQTETENLKCRQSLKLINLKIMWEFSGLLWQLFCKFERLSKGKVKNKRGRPVASRGNKSVVCGGVSAPGAALWAEPNKIMGPHFCLAAFFLSCVAPSFTGFS